MDMQEQRRQEFKNLAAELHHTLSTKHVPGIYRPLPQYMQVTAEAIAIIAAVMTSIFYY